MPLTSMTGDAMLRLPGTKSDKLRAKPTSCTQFRELHRACCQHAQIRIVWELLCPWCSDLWYGVETHGLDCSPPCSYPTATAPLHLLHSLIHLVVLQHDTTLLDPVRDLSPTATVALSSSLQLKYHTILFYHFQGLASTPHQAQ